MNSLSCVGGVTFCVTARSGLGHLRRVTNIAKELKQLAPDLSLELIINADPSCLSSEEERFFVRIEKVERAQMARAAAGWLSGPVVVDTAVIPELGYLPRPLCLILRETVADKLSDFRLAAGRKWDCVMVPAPATEWSLEPHTIGAIDVVNVGWIYRHSFETDGGRILGAKGSQRNVLIATGGGGGAENSERTRSEIDRIIAQMRSETDSFVKFIQAAGPRSCSTLRNIDERCDVGSALHSAFAEADVVFSTAGYNSVLELACTDTPVLFFPVDRSYDDQHARAARWAARLGRLHSVGKVRESADWAIQVLQGGAHRAAVDLGQSGCATAAKRIIQFSGETEQTSDRLFEKRLKESRVGFASQIARNSVRVFSGGVTTLPATTDTTAGLLRFARISGISARERLAANRVDPASTDFRSIEHILEQVFGTLRQLHQVPVAEVEAFVLEPWQKILPRLPVLETKSGNDQPDLGRFVELLVQRQKLLIERSLLIQRYPHCIVHGDFHCGQLLSPSDAEDLILIDLDDLAIGWAEADIGNFAAHFVTSEDLYRGDVFQGFEAFSERSIALYGKCSRHEVCPALVDYFGSISLLRRALKIAERDPNSPISDKARRASELIFERCRLALIANDNKDVSTHAGHARHGSHEGSGARA